MNEKDANSPKPGFTSREMNSPAHPESETLAAEMGVPVHQASPAPDLPPKSGPEYRAAQPRKPKPMRWLILAAILGIFAYVGMAPRLRQSHQLEQDVAALKDAVPTVQVVKLSTAQPSTDLSLPSNIQAIDETTINARTSGYLKSRFVDIGSVVKKGQLLAVVDSPEMDQQVGESLAEVAKSRSNVSQAQADVSHGMAGVAASKAVVIQDKAAVSEANAQLASLLAEQTRVESSIRVAMAQQKESRTRLDASNADLTRAKAGFTIADKTRTRWKALYKENAVSGQEVDEKQADYDSASARVSAANADVSTAQANLEAANEAIQVARAQLDSAKANVESGKEKVASAQATVDAASAAVQASYATVRAGNSGVNSAAALVSADQANAMRYQAMQSFERIVAPFAGVITARNVDEGDLVGPPSSSNTGGSSDQTVTAPRVGLFGLARIDQLRILLDVPQTFSGQIKKDQEADVLVPEMPGKVFHGHVFLVSGALDSESRTLLVEVRLENPTGELKPGTYAVVHFKSLSTEGIQIPANTLIFDAAGTRVAELMPDNTVHFVKIVEGRDLGSTVEVLTGLTGHENLIANPASTLAEGEKVEPLAPDDSNSTGSGK